MSDMLNEPLPSWKDMDIPEETKLALELWFRFNQQLTRIADALENWRQ